MNANVAVPMIDRGRQHILIGWHPFLSCQCLSPTSTAFLSGSERKRRCHAEACSWGGLRPDPWARHDESHSVVNQPSPIIGFDIAFSTDAFAFNCASLRSFALALPATYRPTVTKDVDPALDHKIPDQLKSSNPSSSTAFDQNTRLRSSRSGNNSSARRTSGP